MSTTSSAILPATEIDQYKATLADFDAAPPGSEEQGGIAYDCTVALRALLGHIDALTAGAVDEEALADESMRLWEECDVDLTDVAWYRAEHGRIGSTLYTLGRAAGRSEGEAERARLTAERDKALHRADNLIDRSEHNQEQACDARRERDEARAEIARLTAELAAERQKHGEDLLATMRSHDAALVAARAEGARVEREAIAHMLETYSKPPAWIAPDIADSLARRIRARSEGGPT